MSVPAAQLPARGARFDALAAHLRVPLYRDGYALVLSSGLTAVLGLLYWLLAARSYTPHAVGVNTAAISAMMFLAGMAQLNLMSALLRFVPVLGRLRRRFITACYVVAGSTAVGCAAVFLLGLHVWAPRLGALDANTGMIAWFIAATAIWAVFNLQDSALTALGAAVAVPVENVVYGIAKIVLLALLASASPRYGIFGSWSAALLVSVLPVNALIFGRLLRRKRGEVDSTKVPTRSEIVRFVAPDYVGALLWLAATTLMPVIVVAIAGATSNAFFSVAWMITLPLILVSINTGQALVVAGARDPDRLAEYARKVLRQTARLVVPAAAVIALAAPYVLRLFGRAYADHAATTLSLLALSAIPNVITTLCVSRYRVQRRMRALVTLLAALCGSVLFLGPILLTVMGIAGVGLAWLLCQSVVAVVLCRMDSSGIAPRGASAFEFAARIGVVGALRWLQAHRFRRRNRRALARSLPAGFVLTKVETALNDVAVGRGRGPENAAEVMVKLALSDSAAVSLQRAADVLAALDGDPRLDHWDVPRPRILASGQLNGRCYVWESRLSGVTLSQRLSERADGEQLRRAAIAAIEGLHRRTEEIVTVDSELLDRWIDRPAQAVHSVVARSVARAEALQGLTHELRTWLAGRTVAAGWIHGDFVPQNVLIDPDHDERVTGIIDWELADTPGLPPIDTTMFILATRSQLERREIGHLVTAFLSGNASGTLTDELAEAAHALDDLDDARLLTLLCWLRHVADTIAKSKRFTRHPVWKRCNVYRVLDTLHTLAGE